MAGLLANTIRNIVADGIAGDGRDDKTRCLLNGDQADQNAGTERIAKQLDRETERVQRQLDRALEAGDSSRVEELRSTLEVMTNPGLRDRAILSRAAFIKYGEDAGRFTAADTIGADNSVVRLSSGAQPPTPLFDANDIVVEALGPIRADSEVGRVVVDSLSYGKGLEERYGSTARFAIAGFKTLATGGIAPLLSYGAEQGISIGIENLPAELVQPLAEGLGDVNNFVGTNGGGYLLGKAPTSVSPSDSGGVSWAVEALLGIGVGALTAKAFSAYRASRAGRIANEIGILDHVPGRGVGFDGSAAGRTRAFQFAL